MKYLANSDSLFSRVGGMLVNLVMLNVVFLVTCIPIVTIGISTTALFTVTFKMINTNENTGLVKLYFSAWKENFARGLALGLTQIALTVLLVILLKIQQVLPTISFVIGGVGVLVAAMYYGLAFVYVYAYTSRYNDTYWNSLKACVQMGLRKWQQSAALLITLIAIVLLMSSAAWLLALGMMILTAFGFSGLAYLASAVELDVFTSFEKQR
ncbi:YesL family protein [Lacticaseibacillus jixiensis]|uniref:YesL family protein n=1 Tax=Lacticaseibacillus jixiensis TaxID=3231926 RepID=UPI0036F2A473